MQRKEKDYGLSSRVLDYLISRDYTKMYVNSDLYDENKEPLLK